MRSFFITVLLAVGIAGGLAYYLELFDPNDLPFVRTNNTTPDDGETNKNPEVVKIELGEMLYTPAEDTAIVVPPRANSRRDPIIVPNCQLVVKNSQKVPAKREGQILFVGQPISGDASRQIDDNVKLQTTKITLGKDQDLDMKFREWNENDLVNPGAVVAVVNPALAFKEFQKAEKKLEIAEKEELSAKKTADEMYNRYLREDSAYRKGAGTPADVAIAKLTWERHKIDAENKTRAIELAKIEMDMAKIVYEEHFLHNKLSGKARIKLIMKQTGEALQKSETVMVLEDVEHLRAQGRIDAAYLDRIRMNRLNKQPMKVSIEPRRKQKPWRVLKDHKAEITDVAISKDDQILSASKDGTVRVWTVTRSRAMRVFEHKEDNAFLEVLSLDCTGKGAKSNYCITGAADGSIRMFDLDDPSGDPKWLRKEHRDGVTVLAISPDGEYFASGGEDNRIFIWEVATGKKLYALDEKYGIADPHRGTITSLHFTPQTRLVSAARDGSLRVWELHKNGAKMLSSIQGRNGTVGKLDVSQDGRYMAFDRGQVIHFLSIPDGLTTSILHNTTAGVAFDTFARFSSDDQLLLTAGAPEGGLQLWKAPTEEERGFEITLLTPDDGSSATCAAFAHHSIKLGNGMNPQNSFAVSGCKAGYLYVWEIPSKELVEKCRICDLALDHVDFALQGGRDVRIAVDVDNPNEMLAPGTSVTLVIEEQ